MDKMLFIIVFLLLNCSYGWSVVHDTNRKKVSGYSSFKRPVAVLIYRTINPFPQDDLMKERIENVFKEPEFSSTFRLEGIYFDSVNHKGSKSLVVIDIDGIERKNKGLYLVNAATFALSLGLIPLYIKDNFYSTVYCYDKDGDRKVTENGYDPNIEQRILTGWFFLFKKYYLTEEPFTAVLRDRLRNYYWNHLQIKHTEQLESVAEDTYSLDTTKIYTVNDIKGLFLRQGPGQENSSIQLLPYKTRVELIQRTSKTERIKGNIGTWIYVSANGRNGYVFDYYLDPDR